MEYLDIVNKEDKVIGKGTRRSVHEKHNIHRGVHVFIVNRKGEILIQQRSKDKDDRPLYYDASVGAQVLSGETYRQAALREAEEELGISGIKLKKICKYKSFSDRQREIRTLFSARHDGPFKINKEEVEKIEFWSVEKVQEVIRKGSVNFTTGFEISFRHYLKYINW